MLDKGNFIAGMTLLKKTYLDWSFDLNDDTLIAVWYSSFKNLTDDQFKRLINEYREHNHKPPMSIRALTEILVNKFLATAKIPPEKALDTVRNIINENGGWEYGRAGIYKDLERYPKSLTETVREFEGTLSTMPVGDTYAADRFRRAYEERLKASATREVDRRLGLALPEPKNDLGTSALPYEV